MSPAQYLDWYYYWKKEPFGELRMDYRFATLSAQYANASRDSKTHPQPYPVEDFLLKFRAPDAPKERQTVKEKIAIAHAIVAAWNASVKKK